MGLFEGPRLRLLLIILRLFSRGRRRRQREGFSLEFLPGVCDPAPTRLLSFAPLFRASVAARRGGEILEVGAGAGLWGLMQLRAALQHRGAATLTASELPGCSLEPLRESAAQAALPEPECVYGDLFAPLAGRRFELILFNPPFHLRAPRNPSERSYCGGAAGEVVHRFLRALPEHLKARGEAHIILPQREATAYQRALTPLSPQRLARRWLPLLGWVELLSLSAPRLELSPPSLEQ